VTLELRYGRADKCFGEDREVDGSTVETLEDVEDFFIAAFARWTGLFFVKVFFQLPDGFDAGGHGEKMKICQRIKERIFFLLFL